MTIILLWERVYIDNELRNWIWISTWENILNLFTSFDRINAMLEKNNISHNCLEFIFWNNCFFKISQLSNQQLDILENSLPNLIELLKNINWFNLDIDDLSLLFNWDVCFIDKFYYLFINWFEVLKCFEFFKNDIQKFVKYINDIVINKKYDYLKIVNFYKSLDLNFLIQIDQENIIDIELIIENPNHEKIFEIIKKLENIDKRIIKFWLMFMILEKIWNSKKFIDKMNTKDQFEIWNLYKERLFKYIIENIYCDKFIDEMIDDFDNKFYNFLNESWWISWMWYDELLWNISQLFINWNWYKYLTNLYIDIISWNDMWVYLWVEKNELYFRVFYKKFLRIVSSKYKSICWFEDKILENIKNWKKICLDEKNKVKVLNYFITNFINRSFEVWKFSLSEGKVQKIKKSLIQFS